MVLNDESATDQPACPMRILFVEDNPRDVKLVVAALEREGNKFVSLCVDTPELMERTLQQADYDVVIADYNLVTWNAMDALEILKKSGKDIPFIVVSGSIGDEEAAHCIKQGATDYILKDRLARLSSAIQHAIEEKVLREKQKAAHAAVLRSEMQYRTMIEDSPYGIYRVQADGKILMANPALVAMLGYQSEAELLLRNSLEFYDDPTMREFLLSQAEAEDISAYEAKWRRKDGAPLTVKMMGHKRKAENGASETFEVFVEDVTGQRLLEQQFQQAQKMEAVGQLAGGMAHDFNNLLMVIGGCAQLLEELKANPEKVEHHARQIQNAANKAATVIRQLMIFSRKQAIDRVTLNLNAIVEDLWKMMPRFLGEDIEMVLSLDPSLGSIAGDQGQIEQVLMNLAVNARDAMPGGGKLVVETANASMDADSSNFPDQCVRAADYATLAVRDTGIGMSAETQARIFEPFFSTKDRTKGTGLGLASVYGIVKQCGGFIHVDSALGKGTTFKIYFPRIEQPAMKAAAIEQRISPRGTETILLVEDEALLRDVLKEYLSAKGYQLLVSKHGAEALEICAQYDKPIHLLVTDVVLPGLAGPEVAAKVRQMYSSIKVIFLSGYTDRDMSEEALGKCALFMQKPFSLNLFAQKLREVLASD